MAAATVLFDDLAVDDASRQACSLRTLRTNISQLRKKRIVLVFPLNRAPFSMRMSTPRMSSNRASHGSLSHSVVVTDPSTTRVMKFGEAQAVKAISMERHSAGYRKRRRRNGPLMAMISVQQIGLVNPRPFHRISPYKMTYS
ncbi:MAG: hypothetical protein NTZ14_14440 [Hyphomicrobiales bacterium]|nr:hypothetical protein [Hyphomicrobiales bacterium]